jgi:hypothetical protein
LWSLASLTLAGIAIFAIVLSRDEFLSRVAKTPPARLDWSFLATTLSYLVPLLIVVITQYPDASDIVFSRFGALLRVFER